MKTAEERGMELLYVPMGQLPPLALKFMRHLSVQVGMCIEVCLAAYTVYAQCVEGLSCSDELYAARDIDKEWFQKESE